jgi:anthrone oxygenase-like protein
MVLELIATLCTGLFTGAALYVNLVEHPARLETGTASAIREWRPSYRRGTVMQASLAVAGFLAALGAWLDGRGIPVLIAGVLQGAVVPFTLIVILPTNKQLSDSALDEASPKAAALLAKWNQLHAVRSMAALLAFLMLLLHVGGWL